jgi:hypothetical protein
MEARPTSQSHNTGEILVCMSLLYIYMPPSSVWEAKLKEIP